MAKTKLNLQERSIPNKVEFLRQVVKKLTDNVNFPTPDPSLEELTARAKALEDAYNAAEGARRTSVEATVLQNTQETALDRAFTTLAGYVDSTSEGDEAKILSSGIPVRAAAASIGELPAPENFSASDGDLEEEIDLAWNRVRGAASYVVQRSEDLEAWGGDRVSTRSSATYPGCTVGKKYWFRVAAIGAAGQGPWSDPATATAV